MVTRLLLFCAIIQCLCAAPKRVSHDLADEIERVVAETKKLDSALVGIHVVRLSDGKTLYERHPDRLFVPASNAKLFSTALALARLGRNYRFTTSVIADMPVDEEGVLRGDLILVGRGDPSLSARAYPYAKEASRDNPLRALEELADQIVAGGVRSIRGDVVGDDTRYAWVPYPGGWSAGDAIWEYGAPVSALIVNDNRLDVMVLPGEAEGDLAAISVVPALEFDSLENRVRTTAAGERRVRVEGRAGTPELHFWGTIPLGGRGDASSLAMADPAVFAAAALRDALVRRGVAVRGSAIARHRFPDDDSPAPSVGVELARRISPPLIQLLQVVDKVSQNLHAEVMLREVGVMRGGTGTAEAGLAEMQTFLTEAGIVPDQYRLVDGSGLSRNSLVTPRAITRLLTFEYASANRNAWISLLPVGNVDGSLRNRFKGHPEAGSIHAKTGSLGHVRALSGYAESAKNGMVAFSLLVNNYAATDVEVSAFLDKIGLILLL